MVRKETPVTTQTKLKEVTYFFENMVPPPPGIMIRRPSIAGRGPDIAGRGETIRQKASTYNHAVTAISMESATYQNWRTK